VVSGASDASEAKSALLALVSASDRGLRPTSRAEVERQVDVLVASASATDATSSRRPGWSLGGGPRAVGMVSGTNGDELSGCWRLVWTSEKETLWLLENGIPLTRLEASESYQVIDVAAGTLSNVIEFYPGAAGEKEGTNNGTDATAAFVVDASLSPTQASDGRRCVFSFTSARFVTRDGTRVVNLPPFGRGWFDTVYLEAAARGGRGQGRPSLRVARDSRGDTLVTERQAPRTVDTWWDAIR